MDDTEQATDGTQTHSFKIEPDGVLMDGDAMSLFFRSGSKVALAHETPITLGPGAIMSPFSDLGSGSAVRAR